jgi:RimJ/RimL family protein N-acetyltransferase
LDHSAEMPDARGYTTERLRIASWSDCFADEDRFQKLVAELAPVLTTPVLRHLPPSLQISEDAEAIARWARAREAESEVLTIRNKETSELLGLVFLAEDPGAKGGLAIHLGYLLAENSWNKGYATEVLLGLVEWLGEQSRAVTLFGGVEKANAASARVLVKAGFEIAPELSGGETDMFKLLMS